MAGILGSLLYFFEVCNLIEQYAKVIGSGEWITGVSRKTELLEADYAEAGDWEAGTDSDFPKILFVCDSLSLQKRLAKKAPWLLEDADDEVGFYATTQEQLRSGMRVMCVDLTDPEESLPLSEL